MQHHKRFGLAGISLLLATTLPAGVQAAAPDTRTAEQSASFRFTDRTDAIDAARRGGCWKIDKDTGNMIPCDPPSSGGSTRTRGGNTRNTPSTPSAPVPFDFFDADYDEADFYDDGHESVMVNAYLLAQLSAVTYREPSDSSADNAEGAFYLAEQFGLSVLAPLEDENDAFLNFGGVSGESKAYVFYNDDALIVAFEGSTGWFDWEESNLDFWPYAKPSWGNDNYELCLVYCVTVKRNEVNLHNGFYEAMDIIFDEVMDAIHSDPEDQGQPLLEGRKLWITGHSLGGAVAKLTAFRLVHDEEIDVQGVHVFGAPAVGDSDWATVFEQTMTNVHRWSIEGDPAPIATQAPLFYHVGIMNNLYTDGSELLNGDYATDMMFYIPHCFPGYSALATHMLYWPRMYDELAQHNPELLAVFPPSLPGGDLLPSVDLPCT